ncbi:hypothetical protein Tco_0248529, partial [Tanacetum coccineum]
NGYSTKGRKIKQKQFADEKERKARTLLLMAVFMVNPTLSKPSTEWKSVEKPKSNRSQSQIEAKVNPDKVKAKKSTSQRKYNFRDQI